MTPATEAFDPIPSWLSTLTVSTAAASEGIMYDSGGIALKPADAVHATMKNDMSGAGAIHAALFLEEFVAGRPWAHIDIAGVAQANAGTTWHTAGCTGFGARLLAELACGFTRPDGMGDGGRA